MNKIEKQNLYKEAKSFYELAECGRKNIPEKKYVESYIPYIVNMSFATELYLKLILINNGKTIDEVKVLNHNLYNLYNELDEEQKNKIYEMFKRPITYSIPNELNKISTAFPDWRYLVLNKASQKNKKLQFSPYFIKELNEILGDICKNIIK